MKNPFRSLLLSVLACGAMAASSYSFVMLQDSEKDSLVRISPDGTVTTIAHGAGGVGLTIDHAGNYVVAARLALLRVTRAGVVTMIAKAPQGAKWVAVVADGSGGLVVADGEQPVLWRVDEKGHVAEFARYPHHDPRSGGTYKIGLAAEPSGDYLLLRDGPCAPALYRITAAGVVSPVQVSGAIWPASDPAPPVVCGTARLPYTRMQEERVAITGGHMVSDGAGGYLFYDNLFTRNVFKLSATGVITPFYYEPGLHSGDAGKDYADSFFSTRGSLARNPETGEIFITHPRPNRSTAQDEAIWRVAAGGAATRAMQIPGRLHKHEDMIIDVGK